MHAKLLITVIVFTGANERPASFIADNPRHNLPRATPITSPTGGEFKWSKTRDNKSELRKSKSRDEPEPEEPETGFQANRLEPYPLSPDTRL